MSDIPDDLYLEILLRVPVRSTYTCKCVCKFWFRIISSPSFAKMHLDFNTQRKNYNLIMDRYDERVQDFRINSISYDSLLSLTESEILEYGDYPFSEFTTFRLVGSGNGLVCIWYGSRDTKGSPAFMFFNPSTKEYKRIPKSSRYEVSNIKAFGYDCMAEDYKLIISVISHGNEVLDVYMLGTNEWKTRRQTVAYNIGDKRRAGSFVNGAFHWFGKARDKNSSMLIVSLDINNEILGDLQLPKELVKKKYSSMIIKVLDGCLCVVVKETHDFFEVWVMQDYGVQESWVQRYTICLESIMRIFDLGFIWSLKNDHFLLRKGSQLVIYDPRHSSFRELNFSRNLRLVDANSYVESLVSLNSGTYARSKLKNKGGL